MSAALQCLPLPVLDIVLFALLFVAIGIGLGIEFALRRGIKDAG